jgi:hypothetical protein
MLCSLFWCDMRAPFCTRKTHGHVFLFLYALRGSYDGWLRRGALL